MPTTLELWVHSDSIWFDEHHDTYCNEMITTIYGYKEMESDAYLIVSEQQHTL